MTTQTLLYLSNEVQKLLYLSVPSVPHCPHLSTNMDAELHDEEVLQMDENEIREKAQVCLDPRPSTLNPRPLETQLSRTPCVLIKGYNTCISINGIYRHR